jgi:hypothetical protein
MSQGLIINGEKHPIEDMQMNESIKAQERPLVNFYIALNENETKQREELTNKFEKQEIVEVYYIVGEKCKTATCFITQRSNNTFKLVASGGWEEKDDVNSKNKPI